MSTDKTKQSYRILVIDDNADIHDDFRKILTRTFEQDSSLVNMESMLFGTAPQNNVTSSFEVDFALQGNEGLDMVIQARDSGRPYAMTFVDGRMPPGWDGIETIRHLWRECPDIQAVLCTAYADYSWHEIHGLLGENDNLLILKKPFDNVEVLQLAHALTCKWDLNRKVKDQIANLDEIVRKKTEETERTKALLEAAVMNSPIGIIISNAEYSEILWVNSTALSLFGPVRLTGPANEYRPDNINWEAFREDGSLYRFEEFPLARALLNGEIIREEEALIRRSNNIDTWVSASAAPILDSNGTIVAGVLVVRDVTEKKQEIQKRERLQSQINQAQKLESVGLLAGGIAHDFNNILGVILGNVELGLLDVDAPESIREKMKTIQDAAKRSAELIRQLMAFSRKQTVMPEVINLNERLSKTFLLLKRLIGEDIECEWRPGKDLWHVKIDPSQLDQVLTNLCVNARDAIDGVGRIEIETSNVMSRALNFTVNPGIEGEEYVMLSVSDNGRGIEKENLDHIFEPFFTTKEMGKGTGLGLSTVYGIVKQHDGIINVRSEPGSGSTFEIYLPRFTGDVTVSKKEGETIKAKGKGETVLVVEDEEDLLMMNRDILEKLGYRVVTACSPEEAFRKAESMGGEIDVLMTDVIMPKMNGKELADSLSSKYPRIKILFMSGYMADVIAHQGVLDKGVQFIQKPFSIPVLSAKIRDILDAK